MTRHHPLCGMQRGIDLLIDHNGSREQATAVDELLDDLRDPIWAHYESALLITFREDRVSCHDVAITHPLF